MKYAEGTSVPVARSRDEIEKLLANRGASHFAFMNAPDRAVIGFRVAGIGVRIELPLPDREGAKKILIKRRLRHWSTVTEKQLADFMLQQERQGWRVLLLVIKAKLEAVEGGISTVEQEFLAWTVTSTGKTVGEIVIPKLTAGGPLMLEGTKL